MSVEVLASGLGSTRVGIPHGVVRDGVLVRELRLTPVGDNDEALLVDSARQPPGERATALLERCLDELEPASLVASLVLGDREALLLHLRRITLGETLDCVLTCPEAGCGEPMELELRVGDLLVPPYDDVGPQHEIAVAGSEPPRVVTFRLPTVADLRAAERSGGDSPQVVAAAVLARCVGDAGPGAARPSTGQLDAEASAQVTAAMSRLDPQAEVELELTCPACATEFAVVFDTAAFLLRELDARAARLLEEVHALALHYHWGERDILDMAATRRERYLSLLADTLNSSSTGYVAT